MKNIKRKRLSFSGGKYGKHTYEILSRTPIKGRVYGFLDSDSKKQGKKLYGLPVISPFDLDAKLRDSLFIISSLAGESMHHELMGLGILPQNIIYPTSGRFVTRMGRQYFDAFKPVANEVFIDVGCYDAGTSVDFAKWCHGDYEAIYAFEGSKNRAEICRNKAHQAGLHNFEVVEKACFERVGTVSFISDNNSEILGQARISDDSLFEVPADTIDNVMQGGRVTFVKMDIEGSELSALKGARESNRKWRPRLAISLYHKPEDIIELPSYVVSLVEDYKLYIRHYCSDWWETVLYAV